MLFIKNLVGGRGGKAIALLPHLSLEPGAVALLLGPSGSGKTTLLLAIAGLAANVSGQVEIDGIAPATLRRSERDRFRGLNIGVIFQDIHMISGLSTLDNLLLSPFAVRQPQDRDRAIDLLTQMGLATQINQSAETLSRGQAQRAAIARAMLPRPKIILADEPTASLDDDACDNVAALLSQAALETGASLVITTHDHRLRSRFPVAVYVEPIP